VSTAVLTAMVDEQVRRDKVFGDAEELANL
jgi:hypothetical protein